jgi:hypothetical protein
MSQTYYLSDNDSDLSTSGARFDKLLSPVTTTPTTLSYSVPQGVGQTQTGYGYTDIDIPSFKGTTGNYTVEINVTSANGSLNLQVELARINSSGTVQGTPVTSSTQSAGTTGVKTFTFTSVNFGTWTTGNRLRVGYSAINTQAHGGNQALTIGTGTTDEEVITPFGPPPRTRSFGFFMD